MSEKEPSMSLFDISLIKSWLATLIRNAYQTNVPQNQFSFHIVILVAFSWLCIVVFTGNQFEPWPQRSVAHYDFPYRYWHHFLYRLRFRFSLSFHVWFRYLFIQYLTFRPSLHGVPR